jgi:hypothetical protein
MVGYKVLLAVFGPNQGTRFGVSPDHFWVVWLVTMLMIPALYFPCQAFARYKRRTHRAWVLLVISRTSCSPSSSSSRA